MLGVTVVTSYCLVKTFTDFTTTSGTTETFIGMIILPLTIRIIDHINIVYSALTNHADRSIQLLISSTTQLSLLVVPVAVVAGWLMGKDMTLHLPDFEISIYVIAVLILSSIVMKGQVNWLQGAMLISAYLVVAFACYYETVVDY